MNPFPDVEETPAHGPMPREPDESSSIRHFISCILVNIYAPICALYSSISKSSAEHEWKGNKQLVKVPVSNYKINLNETSNEGASSRALGRFISIKRLTGFLSLSLPLAKRQNTHTLQHIVGSSSSA